MPGNITLEVNSVQGIPWSTSKVLILSASVAIQSGLLVAPEETLPALYDIDTVEDLKDWHRGSSSLLHRTFARTRSFLGSMNSFLENQADFQMVESEPTSNKGGRRDDSRGGWMGRSHLIALADRLLQERQAIEDALAETGYVI